MKKIMVAVVLLIGTGRNVFAQSLVVGMHPNNLSNRFLIDLGKGNKMQVELSFMNFTGNLPDMDSLLQLCIRDIEPLKDSLQDELTTKCIDYIAETSGRKKILFHQSRPIGSGFLVDKGELAALKLEQDTVNLIGTAVPKVKNKLLKPGYNYKVSLIVNRISELPALVGRLNAKIKSIDVAWGEKWHTDKDGLWHPKNDNSISAKQPRGYLSGAGDYLATMLSVNIQNYKNYFVPSFSIGMKAVAPGLLHCEIGIYWEPHFLFQSNQQGKLDTYINNFLSVVVSKKFEKGEETAGPILFTGISLAYLMQKESEFYDKHTFRLGVSSKSFSGGKLTLEPLVYFHDLFKDATPGLRLTMLF